MVEAIHSTETSVLTRATRRNIPEDCILNVNVLSKLVSSLDLTFGYCTGRSSAQVGLGVSHAKSQNAVGVVIVRV
jgi:hypothetical protein